MAERRPAKPQELDKHNSNNLSLARILKIFTSPVSEEQAWAVCHQCAKYFINNGDSYHNDYRILVKHRIQALHIAKDGELLIVTPDVNSSASTDPNLPETGEQLKNSKIVKEKDITPQQMTREVVQSLGIIVFQALDYGLSETEEHHLSTELEALIEYMTAPGTDDDEDSDSQAIDDEGIVNDDDDSGQGLSKPACNFMCVRQMCVKHLSKQQDAEHHYRAVCRALFAEALELVTFLDKVSTGQKILKKQKQNYAEIERLEALERSDWARLWIQIMKQLRHGVKLKKVEHCAHSLQGEYELTPYEMLMKDIVFKRYTLNKIMKVDGDIPPKVKHDAHAMILDFIRSRPPLHPMKDRVMKKLPPRSPDPHEKLLIDIRAQPKLRPIKQGKVLVETSRTKLNLDDDDESPLPVRKVIKPDFNLILDNSFEVEDDDSSSRDGTDDERKESCKRPANRQNSTDRNAKLVRRHTIMKKWQNPIECLSLTLDEVMHIRQVLTKAELESLITQPTLYDLVSRGKLCFACKSVKFSLFSQWGNNCRFCKRAVCNKCIRKMHVPTEHFNKIPVYTLSPSPPVTPHDNAEIFYLFPLNYFTGSVPSLTLMPSPKKTPTKTKSPKRRPLQRSQTISEKPSGSKVKELKGPLMNICCDCKSMVCEVIQASRLSITLAGTKENDIPKPKNRLSKVSFKTNSIDES